MRNFCEQLQQNTSGQPSGRCSRQPTVSQVQGSDREPDLWEPWNQFRRSAFAEIMRPWCQQNGINLRAGAKQPRQPKEHA